MQIVELHPTAVSVNVSFPTSASHFNLTGCCVQCEGPGGIRQLPIPGTNQVCVDGLSPGKEYKLKAVAKYVPTGFSEEEVFSVEQQIRIPAEGKLLCGFTRLHNGKREGLIVPLNPSLHGGGGGGGGGGGLGKSSLSPPPPRILKLLICFDFQPFRTPDIALKQLWHINAGND